MVFDSKSMTELLGTSNPDDIIAAFTAAITEAAAERDKGNKTEEAIAMFKTTTDFLNKWYPELGDMSITDEEAVALLGALDEIIPELIPLMEFAKKLDSLKGNHKAESHTTTTTDSDDILSMFFRANGI